MRFAILSLVVVLLVLSAADAAAKRTDDARWDTRKSIVVENRAGPEWNAAVAFSVKGWKKAFPRLRFKVTNKPGKGCGQEVGKIIICEVAPRPAWNGYADWRSQEHEIVSARVQMTHVVYEGEDLWDGYLSMSDMETLCHELGHALGLQHNAHPKTSCVAVNSDRITPGPYDRTSLKLLYKRKGEGWP